jgi:hypothetical protein
MEKEYQLFITLNGEIVIKNNDSLTIWIVDKLGIAQAFSTDRELHEMILFPIEKIPKGKRWKRHEAWIEKNFSKS